jgi:hypothetical protein
MEQKKVTRWQASGLHLLISAVIVATALAIMLTVWYPGLLFSASGGSDLLFILAGVDVVLGPAITLAVFRQGKKGLKFDLSVIATLQLCALIYGMHVVYVARPVFIVFVKDQFQVAPATAIEPQDYAQAKFPQFSRPPLAGPVYAYADFPTDQKERETLIVLGLSGRDLEVFPRYFAPYTERTQQVLAAAMTLARLREVEPAEAKIMDTLLAESGRKEPDVRYVRLKARQLWLGVLIDAKTAQPLEMAVIANI